MKTTTIILTVLLTCLSGGIFAGQSLNRVSIGGDVPKPGNVELKQEYATLSKFLEISSVSVPKDSKRAIQITLYRNGKSPQLFNAEKDENRMATIELKPNDVIAVVDFRRHPAKIKQQNRRITKMLKLGSTEIGDAIWRVAELHLEYEIWVSQARNTILKSIDIYLRKEFEMLKTGGHEKKVLGLLELREESLISDGLGKAHPQIVKINKLIRLLKE